MNFLGFFFLGFWFYFWLCRLHDKFVWDAFLLKAQEATQSHAEKIHKRTHTYREWECRAGTHIWVWFALGACQKMLVRLAASAAIEATNLIREKNVFHLVSNPNRIFFPMSRCVWIICTLRIRQRRCMWPTGQHMAVRDAVAQSCGCHGLWLNFPNDRLRLPPPHNRRSRQPLRYFPFSAVGPTENFALLTQEIGNVFHI